METVEFDEQMENERRLAAEYGEDADGNIYGSPENPELKPVGGKLSALRKLLYQSRTPVFPDSELIRFLDMNDGSLHGAAAEAVEHLALYPNKTQITGLANLQLFDEGE